MSLVWQSPGSSESHRKNAKKPSPAGKVARASHASARRMRAILRSFRELTYNACHCEEANGRRGNPLSPLLPLWGSCHEVTERGKAACPLRGGSRVRRPYRLAPCGAGLSHGLKTVHRTVFAAVKLPPPFRVPCPFHKKNTIRKDGVLFMGWIMGLEPTIFRATI